MDKTQKINCNTAIEAATLKELLEEQGIECQIWDETNSKVARGLITDRSVDVMVREGDYDEAFRIYDKLRKEQAQRTVKWCPRCGSENIQITVQYKRFGNWTAFFLGIVMLALGLFIIYQNRDQGFSSWNDCLLLLIIGGGLLIYWICTSVSSYKYVCRDCKHRF